MWKRQGYLYMHAASMPEALVLPVFMSDGCGYPALSTVLQTWKQRGARRWQQFEEYMLASADQISEGSTSIGFCDPTPHQVPACSEVQCGQLDGKKLDMRFDTDGKVKEWIGVVKRNCKATAQREDVAKDSVLHGLRDRS